MSTWVQVPSSSREALDIVDGVGRWAGYGAHYSRRSPGAKTPRYVWRNMLFRNLGPQLSSKLIEQALVATYQVWERRYGCIPAERLRTEIGIKAVRSSNPGYCYKVAGWEVDRLVRGKLYLWAPPRSVNL